MDNKKNEDVSKVGMITGILGAIGGFTLTKNLADSVVDSRNPFVKAGLFVLELTLGVASFGGAYKMTEPFEKYGKKAKEAYDKVKEEAEKSEED